jgi:AAA domain/Bifunctional DNA primase/polymerase, N-terminal
MSTGRPLDYAINYAGHDWMPFPVSRTTGQPLVNPTTLTDFPDVNTIRGWWAKWPDANVGLRIGPASGLAVVMIASQAAARAFAERSGGYLPWTPIVGAGTEVHLYFRHPGVALPHLTNVLPGLSVRVEEGWTLAPGGSAVQFLTDPLTVAESRDDGESLAPMPEWLVAELSTGDSGNTPLMDISCEEESALGSEAVKPFIHPSLIRLSEVTPEPVEWVWPSRVARGKVNLLVGNPGLGKSFVTMDIAARISRGKPWPDGDPAPLGNVIVLTAEDGVADTVLPRIDAQDGDSSRVYALKLGQTISLDGGLGQLRDIFATVHPVLVIIDPLTAFLGRKDSWKDAEIRSLLTPLAALAAEMNVAILAVMHLNKASEKSAPYRVVGSIAFMAAARVVQLVGVDPYNALQRVMVPFKSNLSAPSQGLVFRIVDGPRLVWEGECSPELDAHSLLSASTPPPEPPGPGKLEQAMKFLESMLANGSALQSAVVRAAESRGISESTLNRAKPKLGVISTKGPKGAFLWSLPADDAGDDVVVEPSAAPIAHPPPASATKHGHHDDGDDEEPTGPSSQQHHHHQGKDDRP